LYDSIGFQKSWAAASVVGDPYVISAKHGLLNVDERIDPYDITLRDFTTAEKDAWAESVMRDLSDKYDEVAVFGGRDYVDPIKRAADMTVRDPYEDTAGIGEQYQISGDIIKEVVSDGE
jgi:hypothetical protein